MKFIDYINNPVFKLTIGAIAISFSSVWVNLADVSPASSAFYRVFFGFIFLLIFSLRSKEKLLPNRLDLIFGTLCGVIFALDLLCWHTSIPLVGPGLATLLGNFQVFILAAVGIFIFKERYSKVLLFSVPLAITGLYLLIGTGELKLTSNYKMGIYYGLATALFYSGYILTLRHFSGKSSETYFPMMFVSLTTSLFIASVIIIKGDSFAIPDYPSIFSLVSLGLFSQCLGWLLIATSLPKVNASFVGLILLLQPSLSFCWDVLFFARPTSLINWVGVTVTLFAIYIGLSSKRG